MQLWGLCWRLQIIVRDASKGIVGFGNSACAKILGAFDGGLKEGLLLDEDGWERADERVNDGGGTVRLAHDVVFMQIAETPWLVIKPEDSDFPADRAARQHCVDFFGGGFAVCDEVGRGDAKRLFDDEEITAFCQPDDFGGACSGVVEHAELFQRVI